MKTPREIVNEALKGDREPPIEYQSYEDAVLHAMKEYAKQWVHEFALQTFHHLDARGYNDILIQLQPEIIKRIEEQ